MWGTSRYRVWGLSEIGGICAAVAICTFPISISARADERIVHFQSDVTVRDDGAIDVVETLAVRCEQRAILHGIFRDLPTKNANGKPLSITISEIRRDGAPEPYTRKTQGANVRYYIGDPKTLVPPGEHTYTIAYQAKLPVRVSMGDAELNWNVTGNAWDFPIDTVAVTIKLPNATASTGLRLAARTTNGSVTSADFTSEATDEGTATFSTTRGLRSHEGFAITLGFPAAVASQIPVEAESPPLPAEAPPDAVPVPNRQPRRITPVAPVQLPRTAPALSTQQEYTRANTAVFIALTGLAIALVYYLAAWRLNAKPSYRAVSPNDRPPQNLSPAAVRYVLAGRSDETAFVAALVNMAAKGFLQIKDDTGDYSLVCVSGIQSLLTSDEKVIANELRLNAPGDDVKLKPAFAKRVASARSRLAWHMRWRYRRSFFTTNVSLWLYGFGISISTLIVSILILVSDKSAAAGKVGMPLVLIACLQTGISVAFWFILRKPTMKGQEALNQIEAYRQFLDSKIAQPKSSDASTMSGLDPESLAFAVAMGMDKVNVARLTKLLRIPNRTPSMDQSLEDWTWLPESWHDDASLFAWHLSRGMQQALTSSCVPVIQNTSFDASDSTNNWPDFGNGLSGGGSVGGFSGGDAGGGLSGGGFSGGGDSSGGGGGW